MDTQSIAIVGMACHFPGSRNIKEFWQHMLEGSNPLGSFCANNRFLPEKIHKKTAPATSSYHAGMLEQLAYFDRHFFGFSLQQACYLDPQYRLLLETIWHALEDSGISAQSLYGKPVGLFIGVGSHDYHDAINHYIQANTNGRVPLSTWFCQDDHWISNYLSRMEGWHGQATVVNSGDNSPFTALALACKSLKDEEIDVAIIGTASMLSTSYIQALSQANFLSQQGFCASFDGQADGLVCSEGCGVIVLKRLRDVKRDNQEAYALVKGHATDQSTIPHGGAITWDAQGQLQVMRQGLSHANSSVDDLCYIETNGLGIKGANKAEIEAVGNLLQERSRKEKPCLLGSVKDYLGHLQAAAGMASLIKTALILKHKVIPALTHRLRVKNNLAAQHAAHKFFNVVDNALQMEQHEKARCALINSFDFFAHHHAVVLQEIRVTNGVAHNRPEIDWQLMVISAKTAEALGALIVAYKNAIHDNFNTSLVDLAYSSQMTRDHYGIRVALLARTLSELADLLQQASELQNFDTVLSAATPDDSPRSKALHRLAVSYCQGLTIDWHDNDYTQGGHKVSLPNYPFQQEPYWVGDDVLLSSSRALARYAATHEGSDDNYQEEISTIENKVIALLVKHIHVATKDILPEHTISSLYVASIQLAHFILLIKKEFAIDVPISILQDDFTISQLSEKILSATHAKQRGIDVTHCLADDDFLAEAERYTHDILPNNLLERNQLTINTIFITGATGFLGSFLTARLLEKTSTTLYCLVRAATPEEGMQRIIDNLTRYGLWHQSYSERIFAVTGNIEQAYLGMDRKLYDKLAALVDSIYHCAVEINWLLSYEQLKLTNVIGMREVIKWAAHKKSKLLNHMSTLGILMPLGYHQHAAITEDDDINVFSKHPIGYFSSKWVAEKMVQVVAKKGLPVNIFRPCFIGFYHQSKLVTMRHLFCEIVSCCIESGRFPVLDGELQFIAPDVLAEQVIQLSFASQPFDKYIYHLNLYKLNI